MATHIEVGLAGVGMGGGTAAVEGDLVASATITPSGSNQATALGLPAQSVALLNGAYFVTISADENIYFKIGTTPDATANPRRAATAGTTRSFRIRAGEDVAVVSR